MKIFSCVVVASVVFSVCSAVSCTTASSPDVEILSVAGLSCSSPGVTCSLFGSRCLAVGVPLFKIQTNPNNLTTIFLEELVTALSIEIVPDVSSYMQFQNLSSISFPKLSTVSFLFNISGTRIESLSVPVLESVMFRGFYIGFNGLAWKSISVPALIVAGRFYVDESFSNISAPSLMYVGGDFSSDFSIGGYNMASCLMPSLTRVAGNFIAFATSSLSFPSLEYVGKQFAAGATNLSVPVLVSVGFGFYIHPLQYDQSIISLSIASLNSVGGDFSSYFPVASFDNLVSIGGEMVLSDPSDPRIVSVNFPKLKSLSWSLSMTFGPYSTSASFPVLESIAFDLLCDYKGPSCASYNNTVSVSFPLLTSINGSLSITNNCAIKSLSFDNLTSVASSGRGSFRIDGNQGLTSIWLGKLENVGNSSIVFSANSELTDIILPRLSDISGNLFIERNSKLRNVQLSLSSCGSISIVFNELLSNVSFVPIDYSSVFESITVSFNNVLSEIHFAKYLSCRSNIQIDNANLVLFRSNGIWCSGSIFIGRCVWAEFIALQAGFGSVLSNSCGPGRRRREKNVTFENNHPINGIEEGDVLICVPCDAGFESAKASLSFYCVSCVAGKGSDMDSARCESCLPGTFGPGASPCVSCPVGYFSPAVGATSNATCTECRFGLYSDTVGSSICSSCPLGSITTSTGSVSLSDCIQCTSGKFSASGAVCAPCPAGSISQAGAISCTFCGEGQIANAAATGCTNCSAGTYAPFGATRCFNCGPGSFSADLATACSFCSPGLFSSDSTGKPGSCKLCPPGQFSLYFGQTYCEQCAPGTSSSVFGSNSSLSCIPCGFGFYSPAGSTVCTQCTSGTFTSSNQSALCETCPLGTIPQAGSCTDCTAGTYAPFGSSICVVCPSGSWSDNAAEKCTLCAPGRFSSSSRANSSLSCQECDPGSYSLSAGSSSCSLCEPGTASTAGGASFYPCQSCLAGSFASIAGSSACSECAAGSISTANKSVSCFPCPQGKYQPDSGQTFCLSCPSGTTNEFSGKPSCSTCFPGTAPLTASSGCVECPRGFASSDGRSCSDCKGQFFASRSGLSACEQCPIGQSSQSPWGPCVPCAQSGYYVDAVLGCQPCANGTFLNTDTGTCSPCAAGFWSGEALLKCYPCPKGTERPASILSGCRSCIAGYVAPVEATASCSLCGRGFYVVNSSLPCYPCQRNTFSSTIGAVSCTGCASNVLCPLATAVPVDSRQIPFFSGLIFPSSRYGISSGITASSFNSNALVPQNYWTTTNGIIAIVILCTMVVAFPLFLALVYFGCRSCKNPANFETWKSDMANLDFLYSSSHKSGSLPRVVIERKTVFGAVMSICVVVACMSLCAFLVLNWYYSPTLSSSLVPFGYVGEPDPVARLQFDLDLWGWSGPCVRPLDGACELDLSYDGIGHTNGSQWSAVCTNRTYSCNIQLSAPAAIVSSFGSIRIGSSQGGNAMGLTYRASITPSLNSSALLTDLSETIFAGPSDVFGGANPVIISLSTKWAKLRDEIQGTGRDGWVVGSAGVSPGTTLNNVTFLDPSLDKQFRLLIGLARGTEFLVITINYSSSIAILIGSIIGYLLGVVVLGRIIMRFFEWAHQKRHDAPTVVTEYLASLAPPPVSAFNDHKSGLAMNKAVYDDPSRFTHQFDANSWKIQDVEMDDEIAKETVPARY